MNIYFYLLVQNKLLLTWVGSPIYNKCVRIVNIMYLCYTSYTKTKLNLHNRTFSATIFLLYYKVEHLSGAPGFPMST